VRTLILLLVLLLAAAGVKLVPALQPAGAETSAPRFSCARTLRPGADVGKAIDIARGGMTICLAGGAYPRIEAASVRKSPPVTVRSAPEARAKVDGIELVDPTGLRFIGLDLTSGVTITPSGHDLRFRGNDITGTNGIYLFGDYRIGKRVENVRIEANSIHDIDYVGEQGVGSGYGIEGVGDVRRMTIRGNTIKSPASDYIQSASPVRWVVDRNTFLGPSLLGDHEDHQDLWQIFGGGRDIRFTNNVARNTETQESLLFQEGEFRKVVVENNLFDHDSRGYSCQIYQAEGLTFRRNTIVGSRWGCLFRDLAQSPPGSDYRVERNIFVETRDGADLTTEGRAAAWGNYDYNVSGDASARGRHSVRRWKPDWVDTDSYEPIQLPFAAGYRAP
jgi:nitrous oxidase accessory protein NosD